MYENKKDLLGIDKERDKIGYNKILIIFNNLLEYCDHDEAYIFMADSF